MSYLELDELVVGTWYVCQLYDGSEVNLQYFGGPHFECGQYLYTILGDVRYVLRLAEETRPHATTRPDTDS